MNATTSDMLLETLIARTIGEESVLAMSTLLAAPVPAGVIRYMRAEIVNRLAEDLSHAPHFARVASPTAGPDAVRDALLTHAAGQYIFPREEFLGMIENATRFTENYLCRPRWTLSSFLFLEQPEITAEMLLRKLEYVTDYAYLPQLLRRMVTHSGKQVITAHECIAHITRIDDAVIREHTPRERALLTRPIFQFFSLSPDIENKPIALRALLLFLEDKQFGPLREYTEGIWQIRGKSEITMEEFVALNEDFAIGRSSFAPMPATVEPAPEPAPAPPEIEILSPTANPPEPALPETPSSEASTWDAPSLETTPSPAESVQESLPFMEPQQPAGAQSAPQGPILAEPEQPQSVEPEPVQQQPVTAEPEQPQSLEPEPVQQQPVVAEPVQPQSLEPEPVQQLPVVAEPVQPQSVEPEPVPLLAPLTPSLREMIPGNLRRRFVNVICGKDAEFYDLVIARLDEMHSWPQASMYIRELFEINSIDPFNDTAIAFTDVVQKRCDRSRMAQQ